MVHGSNDTRHYGLPTGDRMHLQEHSLPTPSMILTAILYFLTASATAFVDPVRRHVHKRKHHASTQSTDTINFLLARNGRREILQSAVTMSLVAGSGLHNSSAVPTFEVNNLLADLPMIRFGFPGSPVAYVGVQVCIKGKEKPVEFMIDTGLTLEMMTPHLRDQLGLKSQRISLQGLSAGGSSASSDLVTWNGASLCDKSKKIALPELHAVVTDFPQAHIDPKHDPVEGMLGLEVLSQYDVDLDFPAGRIRLYHPGTAAESINTRRMVEIPAVVINETGLLGIRLTNDKQRPPILGLLDCGSSFSAINWVAAGYLGFPTNRNDPIYQKGPKILAVGIDGHPLQLCTISQSLSFAGDGQKNSQGKLIGFESPPPTWRPWKQVQLAVGDLPVFPILLGDGVNPFTGPAALIGLDVLGQRRVILESARSAKSRSRRIFVSAS